MCVNGLVFFVDFMFLLLVYIVPFLCFFAMFSLFSIYASLCIYRSVQKKVQIQNNKINQSIYWSQYLQFVMSFCVCVRYYY